MGMNKILSEFFFKIVHTSKEREEKIDSMHSVGQL